MKKLLKNQSGQGLTEYIMLLVLVSLAAVGLTTKLGTAVKGQIRKAQERIKTGIVFNDN